MVQTDTQIYIRPAIRALVTFAVAMAICSATGMLCGCSRQIYVPVESVSVRTDTVYSAKVRVDSVIFRDSVAVIQRGDTVFLTKYRDRYRVKEHTDTVYQSLFDSAKVEIPVSVERKLTRWERVKMDAGGIAIGVGVALLMTVIALVIWLIRERKHATSRATFRATKNDV